MELIPQVGTSGFYVFKEPVAIDNTKLYTVASVQPISTLIRRALDVKALVYDAHEIPDSQVVYDKAVKEERIIIGLSHNRGPLIYIAADYISKFPDVGTIEYKYHAVSIALDFLPVGTNLDALKEALESLALDTIGVSGTARTSTIGKPVMVGSEQHEVLKTQRLAKRKIVTTAVGKNLRLEDKCVNLELRVAELEAIIIAQQPAAPTA